jgi:hypothetical protein
LYLKKIIKFCLSRHILSLKNIIPVILSLLFNFKFAYYDVSELVYNETVNFEPQPVAASPASTSTAQES